MISCNTVPYQAWLHWDPTPKCNLTCSYCFARTENPNSDYPPLQRSIDFFSWLKPQTIQPQVSPIDIPAALATLDATAKILRVSFTGGGEPFLVPNLAEFCGILSNKHYLSFNTNLTSPQIGILSKKVPADKMIYIIASLHYYELKKRNLLKTYIKNYQRCISAGYDLRTNEVAHPLLKEKAPILRKKLKHHGIHLGFDPFIGYYKNKKYPEAYTTEELNIFELQRLKDEPQFFHSQGDICNAGHNIAYINNQGDIYQCPSIPNKLGNIYTGFSFIPTLNTCTLPFCSCPMKHYDKPLFEQAYQRTKATYE